ncbi:MAG TPA: hypothetical protein VFP84_08170 [Kofleriaceae bacterium]|nr:hypothetical protein [Kofleriaceae bacterium]
MTAETILDIFEPPEARVAHSAVLVAMTGSRDFLEDALVRFTGLKAKQRAELGITNTYLLLDAQRSAARTRVFAPHELPGLHELQPRDVPPALLHAKLALLAFARTRTSEPTNLRLAILTANFTYTSARHQLELAWCVDISLDEHVPALERADLAAAAGFVDELIERRYHLPERDLGKKERALTGRLDALLKTCMDLEPDRTKSGFIHSLDEPLFPQIRAQMKRLRTSASRNLLLCGSGFYEDPGKTAEKPTVLAKLEDLGGFTSNVRRVVIAEPKKAGALAPWAHVGAVEGWELFTPHDRLGARLGAKRTLHAKFIYTGWLREGVASNGCLYLGSGNLSRRGLFSAASQGKRKQPSTGHDGVNIECGIVIPVEERLKPEDLEARFFWRDGEPAGDFEEWETGTRPDDEVHEQLVASPVLLARVLGTSELALEWRDDVAGETFSIHLGGSWTEVTAPQATIPLQEGRLDVLRVRNAAETQEWIVPAIDAIGRTCWVPPTFATYDDALAALLDFPIRPAEASGEDDGDGDPDDADGDGDGSSKAPAEDHAKGYALHAAAELLEQTAALQRSLEPNLLDDWLDHIERFFHASFPKELIETWRAYRIDVFSHLARPALRPPALTSRQRERYEAFLDGVAKAWGLR